MIVTYPCWPSLKYNSPLCFTVSLWEHYQLPLNSGIYEPIMSLDKSIAGVGSRAWDPITIQILLSGTIKSYYEG